MAYGTINADVISPSVTGSSLGAGNSSIMKNRIINGAMVIDQRNAGASVAALLSNATYSVDRWNVPCSQASKFTIQQNAGSVTPPVGFSNYVGVTSSSAYSLVTSDYFLLRQAVEGLNVADLGWGAASAATVTLSFWVRSSLTGTFGGSLQNYNVSRSYPFTYTINSANTWEQKTITVAGDTTGTWLTNNGIGMYVTFGIGVASNLSGTAGTWAGANYFSATGATSVVGTNGATFYITGVQLEVGSSATGYEYRQYQQELALCQRYYEVLKTQYTTNLVVPTSSYLTRAVGTWQFNVEKRAAPTVSAYAGVTLTLDLFGTATVTPSSWIFGTASTQQIQLAPTLPSSYSVGNVFSISPFPNGALQASAEL